MFWINLFVLLFTLYFLSIYSFESKETNPLFQNEFCSAYVSTMHEEYYKFSHYNKAIIIFSVGDSHETVLIRSVNIFICFCFSFIISCVNFLSLR